MYALRETQTAINRTITIQLPDDFPTDQVEIIVLPAKGNEGTSDDLAARRQHLVKLMLEWDTRGFSAEKMDAYKRLLDFYRNEFTPRLLPPEGLWDHFIWMSDDFNEPMEDEALWYTPIDL